MYKMETFLMLAYLGLHLVSPLRAWTTSGQVMPVEHDVIFNTGSVVAERMVRNVIECAMMCEGTMSCLTVNFHVETGTCRAYTHYMVEKTVTGQLGWNLVTVKPPCSEFQLYSRHDWGATTRTGSTTPLDVPVSFVVVHNTGPKRDGLWPGDCGPSLADCMQVMRDVQKYDQTVKGYADISSSFYIDGSGRVYEARGWDVNPVYLSDTSTGGTSNYGKHVAVALFGNFSQQVPSAQALHALRAFAACAVEQGKTTREYTVLGHVEDYQISYQCPGDALLDLLHAWPAIEP